MGRHVAAGPCVHFSVAGDAVGHAWIYSGPRRIRLSGRCPTVVIGAGQPCRCTGRRRSNRTPVVIAWVGAMSAFPAAPESLPQGLRHRGAAFNGPSRSSDWRIWSSRHRARRTRRGHVVGAGDRRQRAWCPAGGGAGAAQARTRPAYPRRATDALRQLWRGRVHYAFIAIALMAVAVEPVGCGQHALCRRTRRRQSHVQCTCAPNVSDDQVFERTGRCTKALSSLKAQLAARAAMIRRSSRS